MELNFIVPIAQHQARQSGDEILCGKTWRMIGPISTNEARAFRFTCVSYVWGPGTSPPGSLFDCQITISDQTRPALEAAIRASEAAHERYDVPLIEAFWIDAICIPQAECFSRYKTLESMGFIYSIATSVVIVLKEPAWKVISSASGKTSPGPLTETGMLVLEKDKWISRVWTYQELVNSSITYFTTDSTSKSSSSTPSFALDRQDSDLSTTRVIKAEPFFNLIGHSLQSWKKSTGSPTTVCMEMFPNLNTLESTLLDWRMSDYLDRSALRVLSSISLRNFDPQFPQNRLLACLGALTQDASWGPPSTTLPDLAEQFMSICESKGDYSFVYTADERSEVRGRQWRPAAVQDGGVNMRPVVSWDISGEQKGRRDEKGRFWLDDMVRILEASHLARPGHAFIDEFLYGNTTPDRETLGVLRREDRNGLLDLPEVTLDFLMQAGFRGHPEPVTCAMGFFFTQDDVEGREIEIWVAQELQWVFGRPGVAKWVEREGEEEWGWRYCAGIYVGLVGQEIKEELQLGQDFVML